MNDYLEAMSSHQQTHIDKTGLMWGLVSYSMWGFFPIYWKFLLKFDHFEILTHRIIWSSLFYFILLIPLLKNINLKALLNKREILLSLIASSLLTVNWGIYIYAVNSGHILEGSLAYFINPILNVAVGVVFFKENFPWPMRLAILFASLGVLYKISFIEGLPWISLTLAGTFGLYGVTKKLSKLPVRASSALEGSFFFIPAVFFAFYFHANHIGEVNTTDWLLLICSGVVTGLPLFLFSFAAQRIPYSIMGILQFLAPSLQFLVGVFMYNEALSSSNLIAFSLIWVAVAFYLSGSVLSLRKNRPAVASK